MEILAVQGPGNQEGLAPFGKYWHALTDEQRQALRDKAAWEKMSLMAVAQEWGGEKAAFPRFQP